MNTKIQNGLYKLYEYNIGTVKFASYITDGDNNPIYYKINDGVWIPSTKTKLILEDANLQFVTDLTEFEMKSIIFLDNL